MSVCHTCFLYLDQILPAATGAVPVHGPAWSRAGDRALLVHGRRSHGRRGQQLGGGTALDALPKRSPAEAGGRRREGGRGRKT